MNQNILDLSQLLTIDDIKNTNFNNYLDNNNKQWVRHIKYPVTQKEFERINLLSKGYLFDSMGDLYINS